MYKEFRDLSRADAVKSLYQDMSARHRARFRSIHVRSELFDPFNVLTCSCRFSVSLRLRRPMTFVVLTSSNSSRQDSNSLSLTGLPSPARPLWLLVLLLSKLEVALYMYAGTSGCRHIALYDKLRTLFMNDKEPLFYDQRLIQHGDYFPKICTVDLRALDRNRG